MADAHLGYVPASRGQAEVLAYDEIEKNLNGHVLGLIQVAPDVQDLMIAMLRNLLTHKNPILA